jgi:hypothetical protein
MAKELKTEVKKVEAKVTVKSDLDAGNFTDSIEFEKAKSK